MVFGIFRPKWKHPNSKMRIQAVLTLRDQNTLEIIARNDPDPHVRKATVVKLTNESLLGDIQEQDNNEDVRKAAKQRYVQVERARMPISKIVNLPPLHLAVLSDDAQQVSELVVDGLKVNMLDEYSTTPLDLAVIKGHDHVAQILRKAGAKEAWELAIEKQIAGSLVTSKTTSEIEKPSLPKDDAESSGDSAFSPPVKEDKGVRIPVIISLLRSLFGLQKTKSGTRARCYKCKAVINDHTLGHKFKQFQGLCDSCALKKYESECSMQDIKLKDGNTVKVIKSIPVSREKVLNMDISDSEYISNSVAEELRRTGTYQPWNITISDYDDDSRDLLEIPEVRAWCKKCIEKVPHLLALLSQDTINWFVLCVVDVKTIRNGKGQLEINSRLTRDDAKMLVANGIFAWNYFTECGIENTIAGKLSQQAQRRLPWFKDMPEW